MAAEFTQLYTMDPETLNPAPLGLAPVGPDRPGMVPQGVQQVDPRFSVTGQSIAPYAADPLGAPAQYTQRVDESVNVCRPQLVPGLRGRARTLPHLPDYLLPGVLGGAMQINNGHPFAYQSRRIPTFQPSVPQVTVFQRGAPAMPYSFHANPVQDQNAGACS